MRQQVTYTFRIIIDFNQTSILVVPHQDSEISIDSVLIRDVVISHSSQLYLILNQVFLPASRISLVSAVALALSAWGFCIVVFLVASFANSVHLASNSFSLLLATGTSSL